MRNKSRTERNIIMNIIATPFAYVLKFCYWLTDKYAIALILFSLIMTAVFSFVNIKQRKGMMDQARIKPMVNALKKRYEGRTDVNARSEFSNDLMELYKKEKVSAAAGCLPLLIQLLVVIILFSIVQSPLTSLCDVSGNDLTKLNQEVIYTDIEKSLDNENYPDFNDIKFDNNVKTIYENAKKEGGAKEFNLTEFQTYSILKDNSGHYSEWIKKHANPMPDFKLWGIDLSETPSFSSILILIPILATLLPLATTLLMKKFGQTTEADAAASDNPQGAKTMNTMMLITPAITFMATLNFQAIIGLYWIYRSVFSTVLQVILNKFMPIPKYTPEEEEAIEEEFNKDFVFSAPATTRRRSLHYIDADDYDDEDEDYEDEDGEEFDDEEAGADFDGEREVAEKPRTHYDMPARRRYDKDGNKIRSLHFIDDEEDEVAEDLSEDVPELPAATDEEATNDKEDRED